MTAKQVGGLAVIADQRAPGYMRNSRTGEPITFRQIRLLLLEDGSECYGCLHCDYTADSPAKVRPHLNRHRIPKAPIAPAAAQPANGGLHIDALLRRLASLDAVERDRDQWRTRAQAAERTLAGVMRAARNGG